MTRNTPLATTQNSISFKDEDQCFLTLLSRFIPLQYGNRLQEQLAIHAQSSTQIKCENYQAALLLARSAYGITILLEFCLPIPLKGLIRIPIADETTIDYEIANRKNIREPYITYFIHNFSV